jgi:hypothetical protein
LKACLPKICTYQGKNYTEGQTFLAIDGCNTCTCVSGKAICTEKACVTICQTDLDCDYEFFCKKDYCDDDDSGICTGCNSDLIVCTAEYDPVCGCDERTYSNLCEAAKACVNVKFTGVCETSCETDDDCNYGDFCSKASCDGKGTCTKCSNNRICTELYDPVCGCDGITYGNLCFALASCVSVKSKGECPQIYVPNY